MFSSCLLTGQICLFLFVCSVVCLSVSITQNIIFVCSLVMYKLWKNCFLTKRYGEKRLRSNNHKS